MPSKPDAAFIERASKLTDGIANATWEQVEQLVRDAQPYGNDSVEMAHALYTQGRMTRWSQERLAAGADSLDRAIELATKHAFGPENRAIWLRVLSYVCDDLGQ